MKVAIYFLTLIFLSGFVSAHRDPNKSYLEYANQLKSKSQQQAKTPLDVEQVYSSAILPHATEWSDSQTTLARFKSIRDERFLENPSGFMRRSSWLYPDDGCFDRAALAIMNSSKWNFPVPKKVFVFGNLTVKTQNAPGGEVTWWYHVAPLVEVNGTKLVLDPAIEPSHPLALPDWLATMSSDPGSLNISVCESGTYSPDDDCAKVTDGVEDVAARDQLYYLNDEWNRLVELGRHPEQELGDTPPWK